MTRWHSPNPDIRRNAAVLEEIVKLIRRRQVKSVAMSEEILGCPHEEGIELSDRGRVSTVSVLGGPGETHHR